MYCFENALLFFKQFISHLCMDWAAVEDMKPRGWIWNQTCGPVHNDRKFQSQKYLCGQTTINCLEYLRGKNTHKKKRKQKQNMVVFCFCFFPNVFSPQALSLPYCKLVTKQNGKPRCSNDLLRKLLNLRIVSPTGCIFQKWWLSSGRRLQYRKPGIPEQGSKKVTFPFTFSFWAFPRGAGNVVRVLLQRFLQR